MSASGWIIIAGVFACFGVIGFFFGRAWQMVVNDHERMEYQEDLQLALMKKYVDGESA